jgi:hypothetical protein
MLERLREITDEVVSLVTGFEPGLYSGEDVERIVEVLSELKRATDAGILKAAIRAEETRIYERGGHTGAASWLAGKTGEPVGQALGGLGVMKSAKKHPAIAEALSKGNISVSQARHIASAADTDPDSAAELIDAAAQSSFGELKKRCEDVRSGSRSTEEEIDRHEQIRRQRSCRTWVDLNGAGHLEAKMTADALSVMRQCLGHFERQVLKDVAERTEPRVAYAADALVAMAQASVGNSGGRSAGSDSKNPDDQDRGDNNPGDKRPGVKKPPASRTCVRIRVDLEALKRGHALSGETCAIPGVGPVPVAIARSVLGDALLELVITNGTDVPTVVTHTRNIRRALRLALDERDGTCCVPGCDAADRLEADHFETDFSKGGPTEIKNLARLCSWHHYNRTHKGWRLEGGPGYWRFVAPGSARDKSTDKSPDNSPDGASHESGDGDGESPGRGALF